MTQSGHGAVILSSTSQVLQSRDHAWQDLSGRHNEAVGQDVDWRDVGYQMRSVISTFSREDQAIIKRGISRLTSWAVESERDSSGAELTTQTSSFAAATAISMVATFLLLFMMSKLLSSVPRVFGWKPAGIIIVDILDKEWVLEYDTFSSWEKTNRFLITRFAKRPGASFVANGDYALGDTDHVRIAPEEWAQVVRPKARLKMAIVVHEHVPRCPFCRSLASGQEELTEDSLVICSDCGHTYGSYEGDGSSKIVELEDDASMSRQRSGLCASMRSLLISVLKGDCHLEFRRCFVFPS
ncbi:hypothetical protein PENSPDRAFT_196479 [Peniophora sp. CONT]|nr:hypothetical protein PENSPDRAFT_196479 [Peniophora sp. CONT]